MYITLLARILCGSVFGCRDGAKLLQQAKRVGNHIMLHDLAMRDLVDDDKRHRDLFTSWRNTLKFAALRSTEQRPDDHLFTLSDHLLSDLVVPWKSGFRQHNVMRQ